MTTTLITGATGTIGKQVAKRLLEQGATKVRVASRQPEGLQDLAGLGAEVVRIDLEDPATLAQPFEGVDRLFLVGPQGDERFGERVEAVIQAAKRAGVAFVLRLSALGASVTGGFALAQQHGVAEEHVKGGGTAWTVLRPTFFQDNVFKYQGDAVRSQSAFYGASKDGRISYISSADVARVAAAVLSTPDAHAGQTYTLTGPAALSDAEVASLVSEATGRVVKYVDVAPEQLAASMKDKGAPSWLAESFAALESVKAAGYAADVSPVVEEITGEAPEAYRAFVERHRAQLI